MPWYEVEVLATRKTVIKTHADDINNASETAKSMVMNWDGYIGVDVITVKTEERKNVLFNR